jgi:hypothetical protein
MPVAFYIQVLCFAGMDKIVNPRPLLSAETGRQTIPIVGGKEGV